MMNRLLMNKMVVLLGVVVVVSGCSAPKPPQVSLTGEVAPVNFNADLNDRPFVIKSKQSKGFWRREFAYSIDTQDPSPEFFFAVAHADLKGYGIETPIELFVEEGVGQQPQVVLDCVKWG
jgi:hypothetical protein